MQVCLVLQQEWQWEAGGGGVHGCKAQLGLLCHKDGSLDDADLLLHGTRALGFRDTIFWLQGHRCCLGAAHQQPSSQPSEWNFLPAAQKLLSHSEISDNHIPDYPARHASLLNLVVASHGRRLGRRCESHHCQLL